LERSIEVSVRAALGYWPPLYWLKFKNPEAPAVTREAEEEARSHVLDTTKPAGLAADGFTTTSIALKARREGTR
jgi:hypothetical protein